MISARRLAISQLIRIEEAGAYAGLVSQWEDESDHGRGGERVVTEYVAGVTRWRRWLDFVIAHYYHGAVERLESALRQILRLGAYELLILQTPPHAALNEAVALAKAIVRPDAGRLVNAVLRNLTRNMARLPEPAGREAERLAIRHSHPTWMVDRWLERFGLDETIRLLEANNTRPTFGVRVNTLVTTPDDFRGALGEAGIIFENSDWIPYYVRLRQLRDLFKSRLLRKGACAIQDEGAGLVVRLLDPHPDERVIDLCAAPGGKSLHAAQLMENRGEILAVDVNPSRLRLVERASETQQVRIVRTLTADATSLSALAVGQAHRVLLDAPCSGTGVLAKRADLRWRRSVEDLADLVRLQDRLLDAAADLVRQGGLLVYATCSIEPDENEWRVEAFLERHANFQFESTAALLPSAAVNSGGMLQVLPHVHRTDGAFAARLRKVN